MSTPPIEGMSLLVKLRIELDGIETNNHKPLLKSIFGYQVRINLIRKTIVRYEREILVGQQGLIKLALHTHFS